METIVMCGGIFFLATFLTDRFSQKKFGKRNVPDFLFGIGGILMLMSIFIVGFGIAEMILFIAKAFLLLAVITVALFVTRIALEIYYE